MANDHSDEGLVESDHVQVVYVDSFRIGYDAYKFILDVGLTLPGNEEYTFTTRMIMDPDVTKALLNHLNESILKYEKKLYSQKFRVF